MDTIRALDLAGAYLVACRDAAKITNAAKREEERLEALHIFRRRLGACWLLQGDIERLAAIVFASCLVQELDPETRCSKQWSDCAALAEDALSRISHTIALEDERA